jgi:predicted metal-dependent phosphoesterase TrpH
MHTNASDGKFTPKELVDYALERKLPAIAITDHDTIDGIKEAQDYSKGKPIEVIAGIEFSANSEGLAKEVHIVGLYLDINDKKLLAAIEKQKSFRDGHLKKILNRLNELGYNVTFEEGVKESKKDHFGRPTIAAILMRKYPQFKTRNQVFDELLGKSGKAFFESTSLKIKDIITAIHNAGGIAILAHPGYIDNFEEVVKVFKKLGGDGIEVDSPYTSFEDKADGMRKRLRKFADKHKMLFSGGTDFHEKIDNVELGDSGVSEEEFKKIKKALVNVNKK